MKRSYLLLAIASTSSYVQANDVSAVATKSLQLPTVVVTASRMEQNADEVLSEVSVFTREDLDRLQANSLGDVLKRVPGLQIAYNGGRGSTFGVYLRGTKTAQTLVLIDGQRVNDTNLGGGPLYTMSVDQIERIEVLRGARSAIYGSDAIGGVIHIFTRRHQAEGLTPRVRVAYGSHNTKELSAGLSGANESTQFNVSVNHEQSEGFSRSSLNAGSDSDKDGFENDSITVNVTHQLNAKHELGFSVLAGEGSYDYDGFGWSTYPYDEYRNAYYRANLKSQLTENWSSHVDVGYLENTLKNKDKAGSLPSFNESIRESILWVNQFALSDAQHVQVGVDWYNDKIENSGNYTESERYNSAAFVQHQYAHKGYSTELGFRFDNNEQFGEELTANAGIGLPINANNSVSVSYSEGFRAPLLSDLYFPIACDPIWGCSGGNPDLKPEQSKTYEMSWAAKLPASTALDVTVYRTDLKNAIDGWSPVNVGEARVDGIEVELNTYIGKWMTQVGASALKPQNRVSGNDLVNRSRQLLSVDIDRKIGSFSVGGSLYAANRSYSDVVNAIEMPGYATVGLRASYQLNPDVVLAFKIDNLLNKNYYTTTNYGTPYQEDGRSAQLAFTWTPKR